METIKRAIIIAAGQGKRLRPVTDEMPKPLVPVNGARIIDTSIRALRENGIEDIYIVVGYKKELFYDAYGTDPSIHLIENPNYRDGNNIFSMYMARTYLPGSFVIEGDIVVRNPAVFRPEAGRSQYCAEWMPVATEWAVKMVEDRMILYSIEGNIKDAYRMWGISMWVQKDGELLAELLREQVEEKKNVSLYWDLVALKEAATRFDLGIREIKGGDLKEIDTIQDLAEMDSAYGKYC